jgi:hypothetical protein
MSVDDSYNALRERLEDQISHSQFNAGLVHTVAVALTVLALGCTVTASVLGIFSLASAETGRNRRSSCCDCVHNHNTEAAGKVEFALSQDGQDANAITSLDGSRSGTDDGIGNYAMWIMSHLVAIPISFSVSIPFCVMSTASSNSCDANSELKSSTRISRATNL